MRIGILTFHFTNNYGALLQVYALQKTLQQLGHCVEIVRYYPMCNRNRGSPKASNLGSCTEITQRPVVRRWTARISGMVQGLPQRLSFYSFKKRFLQLTPKYRSADAFREKCHLYDALIAGSDQVWNVKGILKRYDPVFFLDLGPNYTGRRVSYAACFGSKNQPAHCRESMGRSLKRFDALSVRSRFSQELVHDLTGRHAALVVDPTLLTSYENVVNRRRSREAFILVYPLLRYLNESMMRIALEIKRNTGMPIVALARPESFPCADSCIPNAGPGRWLAMFRDASFVCTTSFHGTIFALKNRKPFLTFVPDWRSERLADLLNRYGLINRLLLEDTADAVASAVAQEIDYDATSIMIARDAEGSIAFLRAALD